VELRSKKTAIERLPFARLQRRQAETKLDSSNAIDGSSLIGMM